MKKLFTIVDSKNPKRATGVFFGTKAEAKIVRHDMNVQAGEEARFFVSPGPDHKRYQLS